MGVFDNKPQVTSQTSNPWSAAQPALKDILSKAQTLGNNTQLFTPQFSANTQQGLSSLGQLGQSPSQAASALSSTVGTAGQGYQTGVGTLQNFASGQGGMNPYLEQALNKANQITADNVNAQFSGAGRYGSGAQTAALTNALQSQNLGALTNQFNVNQQNQLGAANTLASGGLQGAALAPSIDAAKASQLGLQIAAGQGQDANALAQQQAPLSAAGFESGLASPLAGVGGTATGSAVQQSNPFTTGIGALFGGLGALKGLGGLSGIGSLFSVSDERLKENIREVGKTHDGQKIYSYNYKGSPTPTLGLLAQEVEQKKPEAVGSAGGMKTVNYRTATKDAARGKVKNPSKLGMLAG